jgi:hypothetical protein
MLSKIKVSQKLKASIYNGSLISASLCDECKEADMPNNVIILLVDSEWDFPTLEKRKKLLKEVEIFDPIKIEISASAIDYKNHYIDNFLYSWSIRGPDVDISSDKAKIDDLPCIIVDIMYDGINSVISKAEEELGKV